MTIRRLPARGRREVATTKPIKMSYKITQLYTYPIKSLGGISLQTAELSSKGLEYDRYWMLVDVDGNLVSQRDTPKMALFQTSFVAEGVRVIYEGDTIVLPFVSDSAKSMTVQLWGETIAALPETAAVNQWFSERLAKSVIVVRPASPKNRLTKKHEDAVINFPDSSQFLVIGQAALDFLNEKLDTSIAINRFRPNIVFEGGTPHLEDTWTNIRIETALFESIKSCARCTMINLEQETATRGKEPLRTLNSYRSWDNKIWFGRYFKYKASNKTQLRVGDQLHVLNQNES